MHKSWLIDFLHHLLLFVFAGQWNWPR